METTEIWKDILGYEGYYQVSNLGNVKSLKRKGVKEDKILTPHKNKNGYFYVGLYKDRKEQKLLVSRLVAIAFLEPVEGCLEIDHINRIKTDNRVENLRWANRFIQTRNRDDFVNHIYICYYKGQRLVSHFRVTWRYDGEKAKAKFFPTRELAEAFAETLDKTRLTIHRPLSQGLSTPNES